MKLAFLVNQVTTEIPEYTTTRLARAAALAGHKVWYIGLGDMTYRPDESLDGTVHRASAKESDSLEDFLIRVQADDQRETIDLEELDCLMLRNDSAEDLLERSWATGLHFTIGQLLVERGVTVLNDPGNLARASDKLYLEAFPQEIRPVALISRQKDEIEEFIGRVGETVLKPLQGAKGRNVFLAQGKDDPNLHQMIEAVKEDGYVLAQEYMPEAKEGDTRLFLIDGEPLEIDGVYAAFSRIPPGDDLRSNISTGGKPREAAIGDRELEIARALRERLSRDGMFFVGLDIVGDKVVEINLESPGGLQSVEHFTKKDFAPIIVDRLVEKADAGS